MSQRLVAALIAVPLLITLLGVAFLVPVPYSTYSPGPTFDILGTIDGRADGQEVIEVEGAESYQDEPGQIRFTTVSVSPSGADKTIFDVLWAWADPDEAVYPYDIVHPPGVTAEQEEQEGQEQMASSQDFAVAAALRALDYDVETVLAVSGITPGEPADGALAIGDFLISIDGVPVTAEDGGKSLTDAIQGAEDGQKLDIVVLREGKELTIPVGTIEKEGEDGKVRRVIGISLGTDFEFPITVSFNVSKDIGGPSAGLMFSVAVYDTLTPGSITGGAEIAGTGTLDAVGNVGPIGGIQQKISAARDEGAELFLVPTANCGDALGADNGDMRLVRVTTAPKAYAAVEKWAADPDADLPSCEDAA